MNKFCSWIVPAGQYVLKVGVVDRRDSIKSHYEACVIVGGGNSVVDFEDPLEKKVDKVEIVIPKIGYEENYIIRHKVDVNVDAQLFNGMDLIRGTVSVVYE